MIAKVRLALAAQIIGLVAWYEAVQHNAAVIIFDNLASCLVVAIIINLPEAGIVFPSVAEIVIFVVLFPVRAVTQ